jgi:hypothetical protein
VTSLQVQRAPSHGRRRTSASRRARRPIPFSTQPSMFLSGRGQQPLCVPMHSGCSRR